MSGEFKPADPPAWAGEVEPDFTGPAGRAWSWNLGDEPDPRREVSIGQWLTLCPGSHPFWPWHVLLCVSLREVSGVPAPRLHYPEAEYELCVLAMNPEKPIPDPRGMPAPGTLAYLEPPDVVEQFHDIPGGDVGARDLLALIAKSCAMGWLVPDTDHRASWKRSLDATLDHLRRGLHADQLLDPGAAS